MERLQNGKSRKAEELLRERREVGTGKEKVKDEGRKEGRRKIEFGLPFVPFFQT